MFLAHINVAFFKTDGELQWGSVDIALHLAMKRGLKVEFIPSVMGPYVNEKHVQNGYYRKKSEPFRN